MTHYSRLSTIAIDVPPAGHDRELAFWGAAADQQLTRGCRYPGYHGAALHGQDFGLLSQRPGHGPGRVHPDVRTGDLAAEMARLEGPGAGRVQRVRSWWILRDPAGLPSCVVPEPAGSRSDSSAQRWD